MNVELRGGPRDGDVIPVPDFGVGMIFTAHWDGNPCDREGCIGHLVMHRYDHDGTYLGEAREEGDDDDA